MFRALLAHQNGVQKLYNTTAWCIGPLPVQKPLKFFSVEYIYMYIADQNVHWMLNINVWTWKYMNFKKIMTCKKFGNLQLLHAFNNCKWLNIL